ncbi:hypothetical protein [uncultured Pseudokineococcus sp.]|uniref:hypothetical protein n=1 Tax=uncultured Pseudokineococcus sp. TaxID=1642928 RepID=UPI00262ED53D|nr:hypothetical protein [uncultured Pseudokineococcus sp.]
MDVYWQATVAGAAVVTLGVVVLRFSGHMGRALVSAWRRRGVEADSDLARSSAMLVGYGACLIGVVAVVVSIVAPESFG